MGCGSLPCSSTILDTPPQLRLDHQAGIRVFQLGLGSRLASRAPVECAPEGGQISGGVLTGLPDMLILELVRAEISQRRM